MKSLNLQKIKSSFIKTNNSQLAGLSCLATVVKFYGGNTGISKLLKNSGASANSISLLGLCKAARAEGFEASGYKGNIDFVKEQENPLILHIEKDSGNEDFIVVYGWQNNKFIIGDPQWGIVEYREDELEAVWKSKTLMLLKPDKSFESLKKIKESKKFWLFELFRNQKKNLILNGLAALLLAVVFLVFFTLFFEIAEQIVEVDNIMQLTIKVAILILLVLAFIVIVILKKKVVSFGRKNLVIHFNNRIAKLVFVLLPGQYKQSAGIINSLSNASGQFSNALFSVAFGMPFYSILLITALVFISLHSIWVGVVLLASSSVFIAFVWLSRKKISQISVLGINAEIQKTDNLVQAFEFYKYIQLTNSDIPFSSATKKVLNFSFEAKEKLRKEKNRISYWFLVASAIIVLVVISMFVFTETWNVQINGYLLMGWLIVYLLGLSRFGSIIMDYIVLKLSFAFLFDVLGKEQSKPEENLNEAANMQIQLITSLSVERLSFSFPGKLPVFKDLSFVAEKGKIKAIYGKAGSGKSTLVSILNRLLPSTEGVIKVDGADWQSLNNFHWRKYGSTVMQPVQSFNFTVLENIGWGEKSLDQEKIIAFCKQTGFDKFFSNLTDGYVSNCNNISAGQKQMVALAAAIYRKPEILLLDEPFAFMDNEMKEFCWQLFTQIKAEMIILIFTGNEESAKMADETFFLLSGNPK